MHRSDTEIDDPSARKVDELEFRTAAATSCTVFVGAVLLWFYADKLVKYGLKVEYLQLIALFLLALAVQNWTVFTGALALADGIRADEVSRFGSWC